MEWLSALVRVVSDRESGEDAKHWKRQRTREGWKTVPADHAFSGQRKPALTNDRKNDRSRTGGERKTDHPRLPPLRRVGYCAEQRDRYDHHGGRNPVNRGVKSVASI